jgi:hypothetical protein
MKKSTKKPTKPAADFPARGQKYWHMELAANGRFKVDNTRWTGDATDKARKRSGLIRATKSELASVVRDLNKILVDFARGKRKKSDSAADYL